MALGVIHILFETMPGYSFGALMVGAAAVLHNRRSFLFMEIAQL
jgi:hypothetical protein